MNSQHHKLFVRMLSSTSDLSKPDPLLSIWIPASFSQLAVSLSSAFEGHSWEAFPRSPLQSLQIPSSLWGSCTLPSLVFINYQPPCNRLYLLEAFDLTSGFLFTITLSLFDWLQHLNIWCKNDLTSMFLNFFRCSEISSCGGRKNVDPIIYAYSVKLRYVTPRSKKLTFPT